MVPIGSSTRLNRPPRSAAVVAVLASAGLSASFVQTIVLPIQPRLPALLGATAEDATWVVTATLVSAAVSTPIAGRLGDMYGKRRIAMALLVIQAIGGVVAALSFALPPMIVARILQGCGVGVIPLGISILRDVLPSGRVGGAVALVSATLGVGGALGLPLSAFLAQTADWHTVFWLSSGLSLVAVVLFALLVPVSTLRVDARIDVVGIVGLAVGLTSVLLAVSHGGDWGWGDPRTLGALVGGVVVLLAWGVFELRVKDPLVDLRVSAQGTVLLTNLASVGMGFALFSSNVVLPQLLVLPVATGVGLGLSLVVAGLAMAPAGLAMMAMSPLAGRLERLRGPKPLLVAGAAVMAVGYAGSLAFHATLLQIVVLNVLLGIGIGLGYAAMPTLIMESVRPSETGAANGLNALMRSLGTSGASAVVGAVLASSAGAAGGPSEAGFMAALVIGLIAAVACLLLAICIPRPHPRGRPALREQDV